MVTKQKMFNAGRLSGLLLAAALLAAPAFAAPQGAVVIDPSARVPTAADKKDAKPKKKAAVPAGKAGKAGKAAKGGKAQAGKKVAGKKAPAEDNTPGPLADFGKAEPPPDVAHVANWVSYTRNAKKKAFVLIDKKQARLYVFDPRGKLKGDAPILLGKAVGDHTVPGIGTKPMSQIQEDEKTTPAGRFLARPGKNTSGEDIIWIDYNAAVSMHRMRKVAAEEQRAERMATPEPDDNRISYGCVNVPPNFYNKVLKPTVLRQGAFVYVLPETKTPQQLFGSRDVPVS
jgi:lipoprotein-anchoring transpeptidase ErfK/SrfK